MIPLLLLALIGTLLCPALNVWQLMSDAVFRKNAQRLGQMIKNIKLRDTLETWPLLV